MILDATTRKLQVVLAEAKTTNDCPVVASWFDSSTTLNGGPSLSNSNGVTAVDIVAAPAASTIRQVNEITFWNADTVTHGVTIRYNDNGTTYNIIKATLLTGESLSYSKDMGWRTLDANGNTKTVYNFPSQTANTVFAGPTSGGAAAAAFRALVGADFPKLYWRIHLSANSNFTVSSSPVVPMDTIDFDPNSWCDVVTHKGRVTPTVAGKYLVAVTIETAGTTGPAVGGELCRAAIGLNGTQVALNVLNAQVASLSSNAAFMNVVSVVSVNGSTDFLEPFGNSDTSAPHFGGDTRFTFMSGSYIGP